MRHEVEAADLALHDEGTFGLLVRIVVHLVFLRAKHRKFLRVPFYDVIGQLDLTDDVRPICQVADDVRQHSAITIHVNVGVPKLDADISAIAPLKGQSQVLWIGSEAIELMADGFLVNFTREMDSFNSEGPPSTGGGGAGGGALLPAGWRAERAREIAVSKAEVCFAAGGGGALGIT